MAPRITIGISDFRELRSQDAYYVDKSLLIRDVIHNGAKVLLLPRPRRFGKTINLSMLRYFFDDAGDHTALFEGLAVTHHPQVMAHMGSYPTVYLTFKDIKYSDFQGATKAMARLFGKLFLQHESVLKQAQPKGVDKHLMEALLEGRGDSTDLQEALALLTEYLHRASGRKVIVLIDEYDAPIHAGFHNGYGGEIIGFMRNLLSGAFKDNLHVEKGVVTGILRLARESIFSGFNNPVVRTILDEEFAPFFGFTETEVQTILSDCHLQDHATEVRRWYNGYQFGPHTIYNPWSILQYAAVDATRKVTTCTT